MYPMDWMDACQLAKQAYEDRVKRATEDRLIAQGRPRRPLRLRMRALAGSVAHAFSFGSLRGDLAKGS